MAERDHVVPVWNGMIGRWEPVDFRNGQHVVAWPYGFRQELRLCCKNLREMLWACNLTFLFNLDSHSKQAGDECHLLHAVSLFYTKYLTFSEHVHHFISFQSTPRGLE